MFEDGYQSLLMINAQLFPDKRFPSFSLCSISPRGSRMFCKVWGVLTSKLSSQTGVHRIKKYNKNTFWFYLTNKSWCDGNEPRSHNMRQSMVWYTDHNNTSAPVVADSFWWNISKKYKNYVGFFFSFSNAQKKRLISISKFELIHTFTLCKTIRGSYIKWRCTIIHKWHGYKLCVLK